MTNTNILQQRIADRAKSRVNKDIADLQSDINKNPVGKRLIIGGLFLSCSSRPQTSIFSSNGVTKISKENTNIEQIVELLTEIYEKEETDKLLSQLNIIEEFINTQIQ